MSLLPKLMLATADAGLRAHWTRAFSAHQHIYVSNVDALLNLSPATDGRVWVDLALPGLPTWTDARWAKLLKSPSLKVVAASSTPDDAQAIPALDAGCAAYCHAFSDAQTLDQVNQVVAAGHVWIGPQLMQRLIQSANKVAPKQAVVVDPSWGSVLTTREREIAVLAANGASNLLIASQCGISERTVKAHLSAIFAKMNLTDRLQLALRVHGIS